MPLSQSGFTPDREVWAPDASRFEARRKALTGREADPGRGDVTARARTRPRPARSARSPRGVRQAHPRPMPPRPRPARYRARPLTSPSSIPARKARIVQGGPPRPNRRSVAQSALGPFSADFSARRAHDHPATPSRTTTHWAGQPSCGGTYPTRPTPAAKLPRQRIDRRRGRLAGD